MARIRTRANAVRPIYPGTGGRKPVSSLIRASDLPPIAQALGIDVTALKQTAKTIEEESQ